MPEREESLLLSPRAFFTEIAVYCRRAQNIIMRGAAVLRILVLCFAAVLFVFSSGAAAQLPFFSALDQSGAAGQKNSAEPHQAAAEAAIAPPDSSGQPLLQLLNLRITEAEQAAAGQQARFAVIAVFNEKPDYDLLLLNAPPRLVLNLPAAQFSFSAAAVRNSARIGSLRYGSGGAGRSRLIMALKKPFRIEMLKAEPLEKDNPYAPWQLTVEMRTVSADEFHQYLRLSRGRGGGFALSGAEAEKAVSSAPTAAQRGGSRPFRVMIDPGHGDFDSGAVGVDGVPEKQVVLAFAKILCRILQKQPGIQPFLTRDSDKFLRLGARIDKARAARADLFISIHADHIAAPNLRGATIYSLSDKASDNMAKLLAEYENKSDLSDGLPADKSLAITDILLDMTRRETRIFSEDFARMLVRSMQSGGIDLINNPHRSADFQVLRAADIPSVLVELGYLSSPEDEKRITDPIWQEKMAGIIAASITAYARSHAKNKARR